MRLVDEGAQAGEDAVAVGEFRAVEDVVDAEDDDDGLDVGALQHIAFEAAEPARVVGRAARPAGQDPVAADALVHDAVAGRVPAGAGRLVEARGEDVGPAVVGVGLGAEAVGDRVAERHQRAVGLVAQHVQRGQVPPVRRGGGVRDGGDVGRAVAVREVAGLPGLRVVGHRPGRDRGVRGDQDVRPVGDGDAGDVAHHLAARRDDHPGVAAEGQHAQGVGDRGGRAGPRGQRDRGVRDGQRRLAVQVGQGDPRAGAADRGVHDVAHGAARHAGRLGARLGRGRCGGPGAHPGAGGGGGGVAPWETASGLQCVVPAAVVRGRSGVYGRGDRHYQGDDRREQGTVLGGRRPRTPVTTPGHAVLFSSGEGSPEAPVR
ncbi:hypothetical protein RKD38_004954 [Streptomyces ambofaciens]